LSRSRVANQLFIVTTDGTNSKIFVEIDDNDECVPLEVVRGIVAIRIKKGSEVPHLIHESILEPLLETCNMTRMAFPAEFYEGVVAKLSPHIPPGVKEINRLNKELWRERARQLVCAALQVPPDVLLYFNSRPPIRRQGGPSSEKLDEVWAEKRRAQTKVAHALQQIQRCFAASRRSSSQPPGSSRSAKRRYASLHDTIPDKRKSDVVTVLSSEVTKRWLSDTSKITKPLLKGIGALGGRTGW
jgi:hypothetical protein